MTGSEMFANAAVAGAAVHICHSLSSGRSVSPGTNLSGWNDVLEMATRLNLQGVDISLEQYPYPYGCTNLRTEQSSVWNPNQLLRQVRRADTGEIITGPDAAQAGRTVDGSPTLIPGEVLVGALPRSRSERLRRPCRQKPAATCPCMWSTLDHEHALWLLASTLVHASYEKPDLT